MFSKEKKKQYKTRQISNREIPGSRKLPRCHQVLSRPQIIVSVDLLFGQAFMLFYLHVGVSNL